MSPWYFEIGALIILSFLIVGIAACIILFMIKLYQKKNTKLVVIFMSANIILLLAGILYVASHRTYYKYNDWAVLQSNIHIIEQKYGKFDLGEIKDNQKGRVAYYIYTDNGPIMPDYLKHYYYMEYDEWGIIYKVYDACQPGG